MKCTICNQPYHPSTGHRWCESTVLCGTCAKDFLRWLKLRMDHMDAKIKDKKSGEKISFSDNAAKSTIAHSFTCQEFCSKYKPEFKEPHIEKVREEIKGRAKKQWLKR